MDWGVIIYGALLLASFTAIVWLDQKYRLWK